MPYVNPDKQRAAQRETMRRRRAGVGGEKQLYEKWKTFHLEAAEDIRILIEEMIELLRNADIDVSVKALRVNQLSKTAIELLKLTKLETIARDLEEKGVDTTQSSWQDAASVSPTTAKRRVKHKVRDTESKQ